MDLKCTIGNCTFSTGEMEIAAAVATLNNHTVSHQQQQPHATNNQRSAPKLSRPSLRTCLTNEEWNAFTRRWEYYRTGCRISDGDATTQLLECATEDLGDVVLRAHPKFTEKPIDEALKLLKSLSVIPVALGVLRSELVATSQAVDEPFRTYAAKVTGKAETCDFLTPYKGKCTECRADYSGLTYYTDEMIRDVLLDGIADIDIRREAQSIEGMQTKPINDIIAFVESREKARNANQPSGLAAVSTYRREKFQPKEKDPPKRNPSPPAVDKTRTGMCPDCNTQFLLFSCSKFRGWNKKPHEKCQNCWKKSRSSKSENAEHHAISASNHSLADQFGQISALSVPLLPETPPDTSQLMPNLIPDSKRRRRRSRCRRSRCRRSRCRRSRRCRQPQQSLTPVDSAG